MLLQGGYGVDKVSLGSSRIAFSSCKCASGIQVVPSCRVWIDVYCYLSIWILYHFK